MLLNLYAIGIGVSLCGLMVDLLDMKRLVKISMVAIMLLGCFGCGHMATRKAAAMDTPMVVVNTARQLSHR